MVYFQHLFGTFSTWVSKIKKFCNALKFSGRLLILFSLSNVHSTSRSSDLFWATIWDFSQFFGRTVSTCVRKTGKVPKLCHPQVNFCNWPMVGLKTTGELLAWFSVWLLWLSADWSHFIYWGELSWSVCAKTIFFSFCVVRYKCLLWRPLVVLVPSGNILIFNYSETLFCGSS